MNDDTYLLSRRALLVVTGLTAAGLALDGSAASALAKADPALPDAKYMGKVMVMQNKDEYNKKFGRKEDWRCSNNLPEIDAGLSYGIRVSNYGKTRPTFDLAADHPLINDPIEFHDFKDPDKGRVVAWKNRNGGLSLYAGHVREAAQPFFMHLFELSHTNGKMVLPPEFVP